MHQEQVIQLAEGQSKSVQQQGHSQPILQGRTSADKFLTSWERALIPSQLHPGVPLPTGPVGAQGMMLNIHQAGKALQILPYYRKMGTI